MLIRLKTLEGVEIEEKLKTVFTPTPTFISKFKD